MSNVQLCAAVVTGPAPGGYGYEVTHTCSLRANHAHTHYDHRHGDWRPCGERWCRLILDHDGPHRNLSYEPITPGLAVAASPEQAAAKNTEPCGYTNPGTGSYFPHVCGEPGAHTGPHICEREDCRSQWDSADEPHAQKFCGDVFNHEVGAQPCELEGDHDGEHRAQHYTWPDSHRWLSISTDPEPGGRPACGSTWPSVRGVGFDHSCQLPADHEGDHMEAFSPGETARWPNPPITGLLGPWGITPDTPEQAEARRSRWTSDEDRDVREFALERAVQALMPVAGAFDFMPGHAIERRVSYADAITGLAAHFATYIENGT